MLTQNIILKEEKINWYSHNLGMDIEMLVFGHYGLPIIIFPTTKGKYFESKDFGLIDAISEHINDGKVKIYCPDSVDALSWYNRDIHPADRVKNHILYDKFIYEELIGSIRENYGISKVGVAGASFGAFHALNFAFRHPDAVSHLFSMSGAFDVKSFMDGYYDENVYFNNPVDYISNNNHPDLWNMNIVLGYGEWDICKDDTLHMSYLLSRKGINHWLDERRWAKHDWPIWKQMFPHYLSTI